MRKVREFTFGWVGYVFCEIAAALPEWAWPYLGWTYTVSNWSYGIAYPDKGGDDVSR